MDVEEELRALRDRQELHELALRYARAGDRRDYAAFEPLFTADARLSGHQGDPDTTEPLYAMEGRDAIIAAMRGLERYSRTLHVVANQLVEIEGDEATGETYCTAHHIHVSDGIEMDRTMSIRYQDRFVREDGRWKIAERRLAIDFERDLPLWIGFDDDPGEG